MLLLVLLSTQGGYLGSEETALVLHVSHSQASSFIPEDLVDGPV